jgi:hypothetical protein
MGLLDRLWRRTPEPRLAQLLRTYPPYAAPFRGPARAWTLEQANANLRYLLDRRAERLAALGRLLGAFDIALPAAPEVDPLLDQLHGWMKAEWPLIHDPRLARDETWQASTRAGPEIVHSLVMDVAILLGELVTARRPEYSWSLDLDEQNDVDGMATFLRPVVQRPKGGPFPAPIIFDYEAIAFDQYRYARNGSIFALNDIKRSVVEAISGAHEAFFLQQDRTKSGGKDRP